MPATPGTFELLIPGQPPVIRQLLRGDAELAGMKGASKPALLKVVADADGGRQQLAVAFVGGDDGGLMAQLFAPLLRDLGQTGVQPSRS